MEFNFCVLSENPLSMYLIHLRVIFEQSKKFFLIFRCTLSCGLTGTKQFLFSAFFMSNLHLFYTLFTGYDKLPYSVGRDKAFSLRRRCHRRWRMRCIYGMPFYRIMCSFPRRGDACVLARSYTKTEGFNFTLNFKI